jgi:hypothetical protein
MKRYPTLIASAVLWVAPLHSSAVGAKSADPVPDLTWHDVTQWGVEGRAWTNLPRARWFDRLPAVAEGKVTDRVWELSRASAGMLVRFKTDATAVWVDFSLRTGDLGGANMNGIGASGFDLYARDEARQWRFVNARWPKVQTGRQELASKLAAKVREYALYLPLLNGVERLSVGVPPGAAFERLAPRAAAPMVFYGTSITQGMCASRPGMAHPAILGRRLGLPVVNLGFAGNGRMDEAIGTLLGEMDAAVYVIDCLPNMRPEDVRAKCVPFVRALRGARPNTPIILVDDTRYPDTWASAWRAQFYKDRHDALVECHERLLKEGLSGIYYLTGGNLTGEDGEGTVDGVHPNDLGFVRQADVFEPLLRRALGLDSVGAR